MRVDMQCAAMNYRARDASTLQTNAFWTGSFVQLPDLPSGLIRNGEQSHAGDGLDLNHRALPSFRFPGLESCACQTRYSLEINQ